jgi:hypothetical protein
LLELLDHKRGCDDGFVGVSDGRGGRREQHACVCVC